MNEPPIPKKLSLEQKVALIVEEYKAIRAEIILTLERRITIISYGLTALAVLTGAAIAALNYGKTTAVILLTLVGIPVTCLYVLYIWFSETHRVRRASHYIWEKIEQKLEILTGEQVLEWEHQIRNPESAGKHFYGQYWWTIFFFCLATFASLSCGLILLWENLNQSLLIAFLVSGSFLCGFIRKAWQLIKTYNEPSKNVLMAKLTDEDLASEIKKRPKLIEKLSGTGRVTGGTLINDK